MLPIQVITGLGFVCQQMGDSKSAIEICQRGLEELNNIQCEKDDRTRAVANLNNILAKIYYDNNQLTQAENYFSNCQELWHNLGDEIGIARALDNRARIYRAKGNYSLARGLLIKSLKLKDKLGDIFGLAETSKELADILFKQGQYDEALDIISGVESYALDFNFFEILSQLYRIRAEIYLEQEDYEKSFSYSVRATKLAENGGSQHYIAASLKIMTVAMIYKYHENLDDKSYAKISEVFLKAEKVFLEIGNHLELAYLYKIFGQYMMNCEGKRREGVEYLQKAVDTFSENQIAEELEKIEEILAQ